MPKLEDYQLRLMSESDLEMVLDWRNSDRVRENMYTDYLITLNQHLEWFENIKNDQSCIYLVCEFKSNPIGVVGFTQIDLVNQKCHWAFYLGNINAPKGSGAIMEFLALEYAFEQIKIRKLCCEIFVFNNSVIKLHKKFGFEQESCFKEHILKNNNYEDVISMAMFKSGWELKKLEVLKIIAR